MVQKLVSKVTYHFVEGHLSRKQTVNGIRSRRLCAQEAALFLNENAMEIKFKFNLVSENSHVKSIKPIPFVFLREQTNGNFFQRRYVLNSLRCLRVLTIQYIFSTFGGLLLHAMKQFTHTHFTLRHTRIQANNEIPPQ